MIALGQNLTIFFDKLIDPDGYNISSVKLIKCNIAISLSFTSVHFFLIFHFIQTHKKL